MGEQKANIIGFRRKHQKLKLMLISRYGHLANETVGSELDQKLIERTKLWLAGFTDDASLDYVDVNDVPIPPQAPLIPGCATAAGQRLEWP